MLKDNPSVIDDGMTSSVLSAEFFVFQSLIDQSLVLRDG